MNPVFVTLEQAFRGQDHPGRHRAVVRRAGLEVPGGFREVCFRHWFHA
jgi:hypothetical protein